MGSGCQLGHWEVTPQDPHRGTQHWALHSLNLWLSLCRSREAAYVYHQMVGDYTQNHNHHRDYVQAITRELSPQVGAKVLDTWTAFRLFLQPGDSPRRLPSWCNTAICFPCPGERRLDDKPQFVCPWGWGRPRSLCVHFHGLVKVQVPTI